jgi:subtilisin-like proprotein convertase family protein
LPFVIGNACLTGDFRVGESFGETWQRAPAGAITYWGSMDSTYWDEDDLLERAMFDGIYRDGRLAFGDITNYALGQIWAHYAGEGRSKYYWETYVTYGDPSLDLRTTFTRHVSIQGPQALPVGISSVEYAVTDGNGPVAGARVAITNPDNSFRLAAVTGADGKVAFDITAAARDVVAFKVSVSGHNTALAENSLQIIPADDPYLALDTYQVQGRADHTLYVGELGSITFNVQNLGLRPTAGGHIAIASIDGPATIASTEAPVPPLAARDVFRIQADALSIKVNDDAKSGDLVNLVLKWTTQEGQSATVPLTLRVLRAKVAVQGLDFGTDSDEGGISPGASGQVFVTVKNTGTETIGHGTVTAEAVACVTAVSGELAVDNLAPGAELRLAQPLTVTTDAACRNGDTAKIHLTGHYRSVARSLGFGDSASFPVGTLSTLTRDVAGLTTAILDNRTAEQAIDANMTGVVQDVSVHVKLTHTYIGDLVIKLVHPDGTAVTLQNRLGGSGHDLDVVFGFGGTAVPDLAKLKGKDAAGTWKVTVEDTASQDEGVLNEVALTVKGYLNGQP